MWRQLNSVSLLSWLLVLISVALGKGPGRRALIAWTVTFPLAIVIIVMIGTH